MKKIILTSVLFVAVAAIMFSSCKKKEENTTPVVTLLGNISDTVSLNSASYVDSGATAYDAEDGILYVTDDITPTNPNLDSAGTYIITYSAKDGNDETGRVKRTVVVRNDAYYLAGNYTTTEGAATWDQAVTTSATKNNVLVFEKFSNLSGNNAIQGLLFTSVGNQYIKLSPALQTASGVGPDACNYEFAENNPVGTKLIKFGTKWTFSINFTKTLTGGAGGCTPTSALPFTNAFTQ